MAARCPHATWHPLGRQSEPAMTGHDVVCVHTMVGTLSSTQAYFEQGGYDGPESHYGIGGKWGKDAERGWDGAVRQWQDRGFQADANLDGNPLVISIETADNFPAQARDIEPWTPKQVDALTRVIAWECSIDAHADCPAAWRCRKGMVWAGARVAIPPVLIPDTLPGRRGIGFHRQGVDPWRVDGGVKWSKARGKECPGPARIEQLADVVIPRVQALIKGDDDDMPLNDDDKKWIQGEMVQNLTSWTTRQAIEKAVTPIVQQQLAPLREAVEQLAARPPAVVDVQALAAALAEAIAPAQDKAIAAAVANELADRLTTGG